MAAIPLTQGGPADSENYETHWTGSFLEAHLLSDVGKKRHHNEDACIFCAPEDRALLEDRGVLFAVADGMGGASAGELASRMALETVVDYYYSAPRSSLPEMLAQALKAANQRVFQAAQDETAYHGMGTTVSVLAVHGENAYIGQVGDSRVYLKRGKDLILQITNDHSLVAEQVRNGHLSEEEARNHSMKNLITRAVGIKNTLKVDLFTLPIKAGDTLLICSDGLSNLVRDEVIGETLTGGSVKGAVRTLLGRAIQEGGTDNITTVIVRVTQPPPHKEKEPGAREIKMGAPTFFDKLKSLLQR